MPCQLPWIGGYGDRDLTGIRGQSAPGQGRGARPQTEKSRVVVPFEDNRLLSNLLGEYDSNLALLEDRLGIEAHAHGNVIILTGSDTNCQIAREVLEELYKRAGRGEAIGPGDFDGHIRHARQEVPSGVDGGGQAQVATRRRVIKARTPTQSVYMRAIESSDLVFGIGPAGTGKTYLAVAFAAHFLERGVVERIILSRPAVEAGERLGFLPGDMREKVDPYLRPLYDALYDVLPPEKVERDIETGVIEIAPLAFMRGRTLSRAFVVLDEAQNATSMQVKMFLTRMGEASRMVITGDPKQSDLPANVKSGLNEAIELLSDIDEIGFTRFETKDVVRHPLVAKIIKAYDKE